MRKKSRLESGSFAIGGGRPQGIGIVHNLVDGINGFPCARSAANIEDAGDQLVVNIVGVARNLELTLPAGNDRRDANGFATVTAQYGAKTFRYDRRCHENCSLGLNSGPGGSERIPKSALDVQSSISGKCAEKSDWRHIPAYF